MIVLIDKVNDKHVSIHHRGVDKYEITVGSDQALLKECQIKELAERLLRYLSIDERGE